MLKEEAENSTNWVVEHKNARIAFLCDKGTEISTSKDVEIWIEVGDQAGFPPPMRLLPEMEPSPALLQCSKHCNR